MLAVLPLICLILLFLIFNRKEQCWRSSVLSAAIVWGLWVAGTTEVLSIFNIITFAWLLKLWILTNVVLAFLYFRLAKQSKPTAFTKVRFKLSSFLFLLLGAIAFIVFLVGLTAILAPPNNWDSMEYHMARVEHWIQNRSIAHYPVHYLWQIIHPPFAEIVIMHLQILSGGDRFANLVQWFSMVGSIIGVSLIAKRLGADLRGQFLAAVICATIPMGILQGSSTQNDYVLSFLLVCFVYYILLAIKEGIDWNSSLRIGASLGLAIYTKTTAYPFAFLFLAWFFYLGLKRLRWEFWKPLITIGILVNAINFSHYLRNFSLSGSLLGATPEELKAHKMEAFGINILLSNIIRQLSLHVATPIPSVNRQIEKGMQLLHNILGVDVSDPRTTAGRFQVSSLINHEDFAANLFHLLLIALSVSCLFLMPKNFRRYREITGYFLIFLATFILFCILFKYQPFSSRYHLFFFVLLSAFVGTVLSQIPNYKVVNSLILILILSSLPWVFFNESRPLVLNSKIITEHKVYNLFNYTRIEQYFFTRPDFQLPYIKATATSKSNGCSNIGLVFGHRGHWEYPLWVLLQKGENRSIRIENVNVTNYSNTLYKTYPYNKFIPCSIIAVNPGESNSTPGKELVFQNNIYVRKWSYVQELPEKKAKNVYIVFIKK